MPNVASVSVLCFIVLFIFVLCLVCPMLPVSLCCVLLFCLSSSCVLCAQCCQCLCVVFYCLNRTYFSIMISCIYDRAFYLTNQEYKAKYPDRKPVHALNYKFDIQCSLLTTVLFLELEVRGRREIL